MVDKMGKELKGNTILDKFFEAELVGALGEDTKDYVIPSGEKWYILSFGAGALVKAEVEFLFSADGGETWLNPFDGTNDVLRCVFVSEESPTNDVPLDNPMVFEGDGENTIIRMKVKNLDTSTASEIVGWFNGWIE